MPACVRPGRSPGIRCNRAPPWDRGQGLLGLAVAQVAHRARSSSSSPNHTGALAKLALEEGSHRAPRIVVVNVAHAEYQFSGTRMPRSTISKSAGSAVFERSTMSAYRGTPRGTSKLARRPGGGLGVLDEAQAWPLGVVGEAQAIGLDLVAVGLQLPGVRWPVPKLLLGRDPDQRIGHLADDVVLEVREHGGDRHHVGFGIMRADAVVTAVQHFRPLRGEDQFLGWRRRSPRTV